MSTKKEIKVVYMTPEEWIRQELKTEVPDRFIFLMTKPDDVYKLMELYGEYVFIQISTNLIEKLQTMKLSL
jgi:hypothetical protein